MAGGPQENTLLHLFAGGCGGTVGAIFTCPLEVIKTRLQSSKLAFRTVYYPQVQLGTLSGEGVVRPTSVSPGLFSVLKSILEKEGPRSLFRGLGPNLVGVAPSRAVYFACYSKAKEQFNSMFVPNSNIVHVCSAGSAAFITNSLMNPIWMVKTRMQLERKGDPDTAAGGGHQVQDVPADSSAGGTGRGVPGLLQRTLCPAHQADTKHSHCLVHLRVDCLSLGGPHQVAEPRSLLQTEDQFLH
ncbi:PREDICTED: solute carrier family 25 member 33 isoform X2 [Ficedula albicollis]|uniref:solute carrier family 25 member 33 isoform X2 n=1 Tax=Ficedula albicollis TaxID=59894 RepID=UPI0007AD7A53|nr:PREDICTED: solute carrier family 25 member 33 isoform X2 [Ficedula albicollis]